MLDEEDLLTCEDTCDDWFQELQNNEDPTGASRLCERVQPAELSDTCLISDATHRWPDALAVKLGGEPSGANGSVGRSIRPINYLT
jgi:hypothetical protein